MGSHEVSSPRLGRLSASDAFGYDELGWVVGEAAALTVGADEARDGHCRSRGLGLLARHPSLLDPARDALEGPVRILETVYLSSWRAYDVAVAASGEAVGIVLFGARGGVGVAPREGFAENVAVRCGRVLSLAEGDGASPLPGDDIGPVLIVRYGRAAPGAPGEIPCADDALWPSAWCCAG